MTPLYFAAQSGHEAVVRALLEAVGVQAAVPPGDELTSQLKRATRQ